MSSLVNVGRRDSGRTTAMPAQLQRVASAPALAAHVQSQPFVPCSTWLSSKLLPLEKFTAVPSACGSKSSALEKLPAISAGGSPSSQSSKSTHLSSTTAGPTTSIVPQQSEALGFIVRTRHETLRVNISALGQGGYRAMYMKAILECGYKLVEDASDNKCDVYIITPANMEACQRRLQTLQTDCRVNLFPGMVDSCEKVTFCRSVRQLMNLCPRLRDYIPATWILPDEFPEVFGLLNEAGNIGYPLIVKPEYGLQGNGIFIVRTRTELLVALSSKCQSKARVCQHYLSDPLTLGGFKFDLRLYLIIISLSPLEAGLCREGLARFCATPYAPPSATNIGVITSHLTNYSLNCKHIAFARTQTGANPQEASKRLLSKTLEQISVASCGRFSEERFWLQVEEICRLLLLAISPGLVFSYLEHFTAHDMKTSKCYQVLGLDILLDSEYRPWLLEVNSTPAMDVETTVPAPDATSVEANVHGSIAKSKFDSSTLFPKRSHAENDRRGVRDDNKPEQRAQKKNASFQQGSISRISASCSQNLSRRRPSSHCDNEKASVACSSERESGAIVTDGVGSTACDIAQSQPSQDNPVLDVVMSIPKEAKVRKRKRPRRRTESSPLLSEPQRSSKYADPWSGYQPAQLRRRLAWPEICRCMAHSQPHRHAICEVDMAAKSKAICASFRILAGNYDHACTRINCFGDLLRVEIALRHLACFCSSISRGRYGLCAGSLRRALQSSSEVHAHYGSGRLGQHELDAIFSGLGGGRNGPRSSGSRATVPREAAPAAFAQLQLHNAFGMLFEVARQCCSKRCPSLGTTQLPPLEQLEWLVEALDHISTGCAALGIKSSYASPVKA